MALLIPLSLFLAAAFLFYLDYRRNRRPVSVTLALGQPRPRTL